MSRSRFCFTLGMALTWGGWACGQATPPPGIENRVGKSITVAEADRPVEHGMVLQAWKLADGSAAMVVQSNETGEKMTVIESATPGAAAPYVIFRWGQAGMPPKGCPMAPQNAAGMSEENGIVIPAQATADSGAPVIVPVRHETPIATSSTRIWASGNRPSSLLPPTTAMPSNVNPMPAQAPAMGPNGTMQTVNVERSPMTITPAEPEGEPIVNMPKVKGAGEFPKAEAPVTTAAVQQPAAPAPVPTKVETKPGMAPAAPAVGAPRVVAIPSMPDCNGAVGRILTVTEKNGCPQRCVVLQTICHEGMPGMVVQSLETGETMTIVESKHKRIGGFFGGHSHSAPVTTACTTCDGPAPAPKQPMPPADAPKPMPAPEPAKVMPKPTAKVEPQPTQVVMMRQPEVIPMPSPEDRVPVPVPLVPMTTTQPRPSVAPPQPPVNTFNSMRAVSMNEFNKQPVIMRPVQDPAKQQAKVPEAEMPAMPPMPPSGVIATGWTRAPMVPVTMTSVMNGMTAMEAQTMQETIQLLTMLQSTGMPSQREQAAMKLRSVDPQIAPYVVDTLATAAKTDSAAMVRAAAIASLAHMKAKTSPAVAAIEAGTHDADPRVRDEAQQAVTALGIDLGKTKVQQTGYQRVR